MTTYFAAHDKRAIYGVGKTADEALADAQDDRLPTSEISEALFKQIERDGWCAWSQSFSVDAKGRLVEDN